jgi:hypothetical protein
MPGKKPGMSMSMFSNSPEVTELAPPEKAVIVLACSTFTTVSPNVTVPWFELVPGNETGGVMRVPLL